MSMPIPICVPCPAFLRRHWPWLICVAAALLLFAGWKTFWFLCDDAFITFRYASNRHLGYGYVWNPPPFKPVEGYTSFLWLVLLDLAWVLTGFEPPVTANWIALFFSLLTLLLIARVFLVMKLPEGFDAWRPAFLILGLLGMLSNRTFLAWTSSGLETALFNFLVIAWVLRVFSGMKAPGAIWQFVAVTTLLVMCRPDGLLFFAGSCVILVMQCADAGSAGAAKRGMLLLGALLAAFLSWRVWMYGELLPNTYYAKYSKPWPAVGAEYLGSFLLEYAGWFCLAGIGLALLLRAWRAMDAGSLGSAVRLQLPRAAACLVLTAHIGYYTLIIGGDHFEYRVYSYLVPLCFPCFVWAMSIVFQKPAEALLATLLFILLSLPIPWLHWRFTHLLGGREETFIMKHPVAAYLPEPVRWYGRLFDRLQDDAISHYVCMRHQEHKIFGQLMYHEWLPTRDEGAKVRYDPQDIPVFVGDAIGVWGWVLPHAAVIDVHGLNDYFTARNRGRGENNIMAHDRWPFPGYVEAFRQNVFMGPSRAVRVVKREMPLGETEVVGIERDYANRLK